MSCQKSDPFVCAQISRIAAGQTLQLVRKGRMAKGCLDVQKEILARNYGFFRRSFIING